MRQQDPVGYSLAGQYFCILNIQGQAHYGNILIMGRFMKPLTAVIHFYIAILDQTLVTVFITDDLFGRGRIHEITENSIKVGEARYLRESCTFKYAR